MRYEKPPVYLPKGLDKPGLCAKIPSKLCIQREEICPGEKKVRIVGGKAKGRRLFSVKGLKTRPTSDKTKESIFNILREDFEGKEVLDLFAGTGNLGIEALSRGALRSVFIEGNRGAISVLKRNLNNCGFVEKGEVIENTVARGINILENKGLAFDFIFLDPPYTKQFLKDTLVTVSQSRILKERTRVIAEHSHLEVIEQQLGRLVLTEQRQYGKTIVSFLEVGDVKNCSALRKSCQTTK